MSSRVEYILQNMSIDDKIGQMTQIEINMLLTDDKMDINETTANYFIGDYGAGSVLNTVPIPWKAEDYRRAAIKLNEIAKKYGRPPIIWGIDSVHGANYVHGASIPPQPINMAATFNKTVAFEAGRIASRDTRAAGIHWLFSPLLGIALEPKWSRVYETFGEDPTVVGEMAKAMIEGIQAPDDNKDVTPSKAAACGKHWIGYSKPLHGNDRAPSWIPTRHLYQYFLRPWSKVLPIVKSVMESYTEVDGVPNVANPSTLQYLLRGKMKYDGMLVTDYQEIFNLAEWHLTAPSLQDATSKAMFEGTVDMSMVPWNTGDFHAGLKMALERDNLPQERVDTSVRRIIRLKEDLAMFDENILPHDPNLSLVGSDRAETLDMATQSVVLVKNEHDFLPLSSGKILVTGPASRSLICQTGGWTFQWQGVESESPWFTYGTSVFDAFQSDASFDVKFSCGVNINGGECSDEKAKEGIMDEVEDLIGLGPADSIERAVKAAEHVDAVVVCVGEPVYAEKPGDIMSLELPEGQYDLVRRLRLETKAKIVLVYFGGRPRLLADMVENADSIMIALLPGPDGGQAVSNIFSGKINPSGRLPFTYPKLQDSTGVPYFHAVSDRCIHSDNKWDSSPCAVEWPFGHGLGYTSFTYSSFVASGGINADLEMSVRVKNEGDVAGEEVVLFFTFDIYRQTTPEYKLLRAFEKVRLEPQQELVVSVTVPKEDMAFVGPHDDRHYIFDPKMKTVAGVGAKTDCRQDPGSSLCVELVARVPDQEYVPACIAACDIWDECGCSDATFTSSRSCLDVCFSSGKNTAGMMGDGINQGWGWNYVDCIEQVAWAAENELGPSSCWKLTMMCRDVTKTSELDRFGVGYASSIPRDSSPSLTGNFVALFAGVIGTLVIILNFRRRGRNSNQIEFSVVGTEED